MIATRKTTDTLSGGRWCPRGSSNFSPSSLSVSLGAFSGSQLLWLTVLVIAGAQSTLLLVMALPVHNALVTPANEHKVRLLDLPFGLHLSDVALAGLSVLTIYVQWISDNQQYSYQTYKHALKASPPDDKAIQDHKAWHHGSWRIEWTPRDVKRGFLTRGLFAWSRHPNFACEQVMWLLQSLFPLLSGRPSELTKARWLVLMNPLWTALAVRI